MEHSPSRWILYTPIFSIQANEVTTCWQKDVRVQSTLCELSWIHLPSSSVATVSYSITTLAKVTGSGSTPSCCCICHINSNTLCSMQHAPSLGIHAEKAHKEIGVITTLNDLFMNKLTLSKCKTTTKVTWSVQATPSHCIWWNSPRAFCTYTHFGCPKTMALQETTSGSVTPSCCICSNSSNAIADVPWSWQSKSVHHIWALCWTFYKYLPC